MADPSVGAGLALGNLATPDRRHVFTESVMRQQNIDLQKEQKKAQEAAKKAALQQQLGGLIQTGEGGFSPFYAEQANKIASQGLADQYGAYQNGNQVGIIASRGQMKQQLDNLKKEDDALKAAQGLEQQGFIMPDKIKAALNKPYSQGHKEIQEELKIHPEYNNIINYNPDTGGYSFNPVKKIDLEDLYSKKIEENAPSMTQFEKMADIDNNTSRYKLFLDPKQVSNISASIVADPSYIPNLKLQQPELFNKTVQEYLNIDKGAPIQAAEQMAAAKIAHDNLESKNSRVHYDTKHIQDQYGANSVTPIPPSNDNQSKQFTIKRQLTVNGNKTQHDFNVPTGDSNGFKATKILTMKADDFINTNGNKKMKGQSVQNVEAGSATAMPVATKKITFSTGDVIEPGELVDDRQMKVMEEQDAVEWRPMVPVIAEGKDRNGKKTGISAVVPADKIQSSLLISQSKDDVPATSEMLTRAADEATKKNEEIRSRRKGGKNNKTKIQGF